MSSNGPALLAAAAGVGFGHAILPDHWVPLAVLGRTRRYPLTRVARLSGLAAVAHVIVSIVLGAIIIVVGLQFRSTIQSAQDTIIGWILIATGIGFVVLELTGRGHSHSHEHGHSHSHEHGHSHSREDGHSHSHEPAHAHAPGHTHAHDHDPTHSHQPDTAPRGRVSGLAAIMVPFGAAASPDLTILPVFLAAATVGALTAIASLLVFAGVTIATIVGLTLAATRGGYEIRGQWLERWGNSFTALVLVVIGLLVLTGTI